MPDVPSPPRAALDATTDQGLAFVRDTRGILAGAGSEGELFLILGDALATPLREQFPGIPVGRVLMSAVQSMGALKEKFAAQGFDDADALLSVAALAAERLDRGEAGRG